MIKTKELSTLHGGDLASASQQTGIAQNQWLDLSTGISPYCYPIDRINKAAFTQLPYLNDAFLSAVRHYYGREQFVVLPGVQAAIENLPTLLPPATVLLPAMGYQEHAIAWRNAGNKLDFYDALNPETALKQIQQKLKVNPKQHLVLIQPNNPSTLCFENDSILGLTKLLNHDCRIIIDEAFIDTQPSKSLTPGSLQAKQDKLIILRSFGKFFGLAGIRLGFMFAQPSLLEAMQKRLPLWAINGPAISLATQALTDSAWITEHQTRLLKCKELGISLFDFIPAQSQHHEILFSSYILQSKTANTIYQHALGAGILLRKIEFTEGLSCLRVGRFQSEDQKTIDKIIAFGNVALT